MEFLKKHYEKILLGVMLVGLIGGLVSMLFYVTADKEEMEKRANQILYSQVKALPNLDLAAQTTALARHQSTYTLDMERTNKLFNPMEWQKTPDGQWIKISKGNEVGLGAAVITAITPLYLVLTLEQVTTNELWVRYTIGVEKQAAPTAGRQKKQSRYVYLDDKKPNDTFSIVEVKGTPAEPEAVVLKLVDSTGKDANTVATVSRDKPWRRIEGYAADLRYDPEKKVFHVRAGSKVAFGGAEYLVVDISAKEVILSDQSNQKKTSLLFAP